MNMHLLAQIYFQFINQSLGVTSKLFSGAHCWKIPFTDMYEPGYGGTKY